jgi:hypothetical protein
MPGVNKKESKIVQTGKSFSNELYKVIRTEL